MSASIPTSARPSEARRQRGLTLIDMAIVLAITGLLLGQALAALGQSMRLQALRGAAAELEADLQLARSQAVMQNQPLRITFGSGPVSGSSRCYMLHTGPAEACRCGDGEAPRCSAPAQLLRAVEPDDRRLAPLRTTARSVLADPTQGTLTPTLTVRLATADGSAGLRVVANILGRVRACADGQVLAGLALCE